MDFKNNNMKRTYEEQITGFKADWPNHNFDLQEFKSNRPPKRGFYDIMHDDNGVLHYTNAYYSEKYDSWVYYPYWMVENVIYWDANPLGDEEDAYEIVNNEDDEKKKELFDFLDFKAGFDSGDYDREATLSYLNKIDYYESLFQS